MQKIALVTGGNRGVGFAAYQLLAKDGVEVILGSRDPEKGEMAGQALRKEGYDLKAHQLDVTDPDSVITLKEFITTKHGRLDVLVNNAGVNLDSGRSLLDVPLDVVRQTFEINLYGALSLCQAFLPLMKMQNYGRVVNVSSDMGSLARMSGRSGAYRMSKTAINALTAILANEVRSQNIKINTMSPGWVRTDMGGPSAPRSPEQGADTILWLATLPDDGPTGGFFKDRESIAW